MIPRFRNTIFTLRNVPRNCQKFWTLNVELNLWKESKLFHVSSSSLRTDTEENSVNEPVNNEKGLKVLRVWEDATAQELARALKMSIKELGLYVPKLNVQLNEPIKSFEDISPYIQNMGWKLQFVKRSSQVKEKKKPSVSLEQAPSKPENLIKRPPVVTVMGHVDHGKTTLLDSLRNTSVVEQEFGGITQHIGAFSVEVTPGERITFIDTPGHAAFTAMRARGAEVTDLVVLVIAADDGVMEQTVESIKIASEAKVPIIVAVNKIDKPTALPIEKIKEKLLWEGIQVEDQGGDVQLVPISALKKINLDLLKEVILLQAELMDLKGDPTGLVEAVVIESKKEKSGIVATLIIKRGTLKKEKMIVAGRAFAKVRRMVDENGKDYKEAPPATPVQVLGWRDLPSAGDTVIEVTSEKKAKMIIKERERQAMSEKQESEREIIERKAMENQQKHYEFKEKMKSVDEWKKRRVYFFELRKSREKEEKEKEADTGPNLKILIKADVYGSLEVLTEILSSYDKDEECKMSIVDASIGHVSPKDIETALSLNALIYAFNVDVHESAKEFLKEKEVDIRYHNVIYKLIDDVKEELTSRILPVDVEEIHGEAEVLQNFLITHGKKKVNVAGARCLKGQLKKDSLYRILRNDEVIYEGKLLVMKNEKIEVKTVGKGTECGLLFDSFPEKFETGDKIVSYDLVKASRTTSWNPGF